MIRWIFRLGLLAGLALALRRLRAFLESLAGPTPTDALVAGGRFIEVDGVRLHFEEHGSGPPVVFIHGLLGSAGGWSDLVARLEPHFTCFAVDLPGSGLSDKPADRDYGPAAQARAVAAFAGAVGGGPAWLVSTSAGARVALSALADRPDFFAGMAALAPALEPGPPGISDDWALRIARLTAAALRSRRLVRLALRAAAGPGMQIDQDLLDAFMIPARTAGFAAAFASSLTAGGRTRREDIAPGRDKPVLVIRGLDDRLAPAADAEWLRRQSGAHLHLLPGCGHFPANERPNEVARLFRDFVASHPSA